MIYIERGGTVTVGQLGPGEYRVRFGLGRDWSGRTFEQDRASYEFVDSLTFWETVRVLENRREHEYQTWRLTLHPVLGGTAKVVQVSDQDLLSADAPPVTRATIEAQASRPP